MVNKYVFIFIEEEPPIYTCSPSIMNMHLHFCMHAFSVQATFPLAEQKLQIEFEIVKVCMNRKYYSHID